MDKKQTDIIARLKEEFGENFRQEGSNVWRFRVMTGSGRSQRVTMLYRKNNHSDTDISRFVCLSPIGPIHKRMDFEAILRYNYSLDIGSVTIDEFENDEGFVIPYLIFKATHLSLTADYTEIWELVVKTGNYADFLEQEVYARDFH